MEEIYVSCLAMVLLILLLVACLRRVKPAPPLARTTTGQVSGLWSSSTVLKRPIACFLGLPYAKPPVGNLRFLRPEPAEKWTGVRKCRTYRHFIQSDVFRASEARIGEEDALVVNVYTPNIKGSLPVMVFIHGGGFVSWSGSGDIFGCENLLDKDVVLVTFNYRLAVLGALYLDGKLVPGNQGMRDQVLALRWVQENIANFGGDRQRVTIFGESAGAISVVYHILSPMSTGLFRAAIVQSGSPLSPFACTNKHPAYYGYKMVERLGIESAQPVEAILAQLASLEPILIQQQAFMFQQHRKLPMPFKPIVDGGLVEDPFLPEEPAELLRKGAYNRVPVIIGTNQDEGLLFHAFQARDGNDLAAEYRNWKTVGPLQFFAREEDEVKENESKICSDFVASHFPEGQFRPTSRALVDMYGDMTFTAPCHLTVQLLAGSMDCPIYYYLYTHRGTLSLYDLICSPAWLTGLRMVGLLLGFNFGSLEQGVCHGDELFLLFKPHAFIFNTAWSAADKKMRDQLVELWTNFATFHNPTPRTLEWAAFDPLRPRLCELSARGCEMTMPTWYKDRVAEWAAIWQQVPITLMNRQSPTWQQFHR